MSGDASDRRRILSMRSPAELFENPDDPRELRRAFAHLAKQWQDDTEVAAHIRALFEAARRPAAVAISTADQLEHALNTNDPASAAHLIADRGDELLSGHTELLQRALLFVGPFAVQQPTYITDRLQGLLSDPRWDLTESSSHFDLVFQLATARELAWARRTGKVPEALCDALEQAAGCTPAELAALWLRTAGLLNCDALDAVFRHLELEHPTLLGAWGLHEQRMTNAASAEARQVPDLEQWQIRYPKSIRVEAQARQTAEIRKVVVLVVFLVVFLPGLGIGGFLFATFATWLATRLVPALDSEDVVVNRLRALNAEPIEPLLELASARGLFPREIADAITETSTVRYGSVVLTQRHPLYLLDQSDTALLRCIRQTHLDRLQAIEARRTP